LKKFIILISRFSRSVLVAEPISSKTEDIFIKLSSKILKEASLI